MPPKRRRRFQGLYYHSSPPKVLTMGDQIGNGNERRRRDTDVKLSTIRIWMHEKDIGKLTRVLWAGQGNRLRQQASTNTKVKRFLAAVPYVMNSIKDVHRAVIDNSLETLQSSLEPPVPPALVTCRDANGLNLIHKAAGLGHATILEYLITTWPDGVHETDITGKTPLHWAASAKNNMRCYTLLTQAGCDEEVVDYKMKTPSFYRHKPHEIERAFLTYVPEAPRVSPDVATDWEALSDDRNDAKKFGIKIPDMNGFGTHSTAESNDNLSEEMAEGVQDEDENAEAASEYQEQVEEAGEEEQDLDKEGEEQQVETEEQHEEQEQEQDDENEEIENDDQNDETEIKQKDITEPQDEKPQIQIQTHEITCTANLAKKSTDEVADKIENRNDQTNEYEDEKDTSITGDAVPKLEATNEETAVKESAKAEPDINGLDEKLLEETDQQNNIDTHDDKEIVTENDKNMNGTLDSKANNERTLQEAIETDTTEINGHVAKSHDDEDRKVNENETSKALETETAQGKSENSEDVARDVVDVVEKTKGEHDIDKGRENLVNEIETEQEHMEKNNDVIGDDKNIDEKMQSSSENESGRHEEGLLSVSEMEKEKKDHAENGDQSNLKTITEVIVDIKDEVKDNVKYLANQIKNVFTDKYNEEERKVEGKENETPSSEIIGTKIYNQVENIQETNEKQIKNEIESKSATSSNTMKQCDETVKPENAKDLMETENETKNMAKLNGTADENRTPETQIENETLQTKIKSESVKTQKNAQSKAEAQNSFCVGSGDGTEGHEIHANKANSIPLTPTATATKTPPQITHNKENDKTEEVENNNSSGSQLAIKESETTTGEQLQQLDNTLKEPQNGEKNVVEANEKNISDKIEQVADTLKQNVKEMTHKVTKVFSPTKNAEKLDDESIDVVVHTTTTNPHKQASPTGKSNKDDESSDDTADEDEATQEAAGKDEKYGDEIEVTNGNQKEAEPEQHSTQDEQTESDAAEVVAREPHDETLNDGEGDGGGDGGGGGEGEDSPSSSLAIEGFVQGDAEDNTVQSQTAVYVHDDDEETRLQNIIASGDMEQLAQIVLNGDGQKLLKVEATEPDIQAFLKNVPNYMSKIRHVHEAARNGSLLNLQQALDRRKFAIAKDEISPEGATPLHVAVLFGNSDIVRYLSARFPETMTIIDNDGRTALHYAAVINDNGHFYNVLLQLGANPKVLDKLGHSPDDYLNNEELNSTLNYNQLLKRFEAEGLEDQLLNDQVPDDLHSSRRLMTDDDVMRTLDRCFHVIRESSKIWSGQTASALAQKKPLSSRNSVQLVVISYLSRFLKPSVYEKIKKRQTRLDHNLFDVIWPALRKTSKERNLEEDINYGLVAPDFDVYVVFQEFLVPLIKDMHCMNVSDDFKPHPRIAYFPMENGERLNTAYFVFDDESKLIVRTIVECSRNLDKFEMPVNLTVGQIELAERLMMGQLFTPEFVAAINETELGSYYTLTEIMEDNSEIYRNLSEWGLLIPLLDLKNCTQLAESKALNGILWPYGRGVYVSASKNLAVWLNCQEHLRIVGSSAAKEAADIGTVYTSVGRAISFLEQQIHFKESYLLGYLQSRPSYLGTGLKMTTILRLPNLMKELDNLRHLCMVRDLHLITSYNSKLTVSLINMQSMGAMEHILFQGYCTAVTNILSLEKDMSLTNSKHIASMLIKIFRRKKNSLVDRD